jgi:hypothetical protein
MQFWFHIVLVCWHFYCQGYAPVPVATRARLTAGSTLPWAASPIPGHAWWITTSCVTATIDIDIARISWYTSSGTWSTTTWLLATSRRYIDWRIMFPLIRRMTTLSPYVSYCSTSFSSSSLSLSASILIMFLLSIFLLYCVSSSSPSSSPPPPYLVKSAYTSLSLASASNCIVHEFEHLVKYYLTSSYKPQV